MYFNLKHNPDFIIIKRFCEDILRILHQLGVGDCSLKGFLAHKLYEARKRLKEMQAPENESNECIRELDASV